MKSAVTSKLRTKLQSREKTFQDKSLATKPRRQLIKSGLITNLRGRSVKLRGLQLPPTGIWKWFAILGPGLIAAAAGNDAGGIATYSSTGAKYGYQLIWVMLLITLSLAIVQEMCARLGAATGRGLLDLIRERFGLGWACFAVSAILLANCGLIVSEFIGIGAAMELLGFNKYVVVPLAAVVIWYLVVFGSYARVEQIFLLMTVVFFTYPIAAFLAHPNWTEVARGAFIPSIKSDPNYIMLLVALIGTTITPYMQVFQQSSVVERGAARRHYGPEKVDAYAGSIFSNLMSIAMIIATAATLHVAGKTEINSAADAAQALEPVAGQAAGMLFAIGLLGASMLAAAVLPLATAYAICEAFGFAKGVNLNFRHAPIFFGLFSGLIGIGAALALIPNLPVIQLLLGIQVLNGVLLPVILFFVLRLANDKRLTGELKNNRAHNLLGWGTFSVVALAVTLMILMQALQLFGIDIFAIF
jgi:NRAMP (natural resistance-associated macrophage protein)-like metal ion transporter